MLLDFRHLSAPNVFSLARFIMASSSVSPSLIPSKRPRESPPVPLEILSPPKPAAATSQRFRNSVVLAPMVRSGTSKVFCKIINLGLLTAFSADSAPCPKIWCLACVGPRDCRQGHASCKKSRRWLVLFHRLHLILPDVGQPRLVWSLSKA